MRPHKDFTPAHIRKISAEYARQPDTRANAPTALLETAQDFAAELRTKFREAFHTAIAEEPSITPRIKEYLLQKDFDVPPVKLYDSAAHIAQQLRAMGFTESTDQPLKDSILIVLTLSKPLDQFWWKNFPHYKGGRTGAGVLWGKLYNQTIKSIWDVRDKFPDKYAVNIKRINPAGMHKPNSYYYVWLMTPRKLS